MTGASARGERSTRRSFRRAVLARRAELEPVHGREGARALIAREAAAGDLPSGRLDWLHEDFAIPEKDAVFARARGGAGRIDAAGVVEVSRLYTPPHIVAFLLQNSLGALWAEMHPGSTVASSWALLVRGALRSGRRPRPLREIRVLDPCCGCGAFLVAAFDLLTDLYEEERRLVASGAIDPAWAVPPDDIARTILDRNLAGADLDVEAVRIAERLLSERAGGHRPVGLTVPPGPIGSLARPVWAGASFDVVATNPPYVGFRLLDPAVKAAVRAEDPDARSDLAVAFQRLCLDLLAPGGLCATVTPAAWLSGREALPLRERILREGGPRVSVALGQRVFDEAPLLFVGLSVVERGVPGPLHVVRQATGDTEEGLAAAVAAGAPVVDRASLEALPLRSFLPAAPPAVLALARRGPRLGELFRAFDGVWTGSNARDTRFWWESPADGDGWARLSGGQGHEPWAAPTRLRLGREHAAGQPSRAGCAEYARVAGGRLAARLAEGDAAALAGVVTLVPRDEEAAERVEEVLAIFNSRLGTAWLRTLSNGLNFNPGYASEIPLGRVPPPVELRDAVLEVVALRRLQLAGDPTADCFVEVPARWRAASLAREIADAEAVVDGLLFAHLGIDARDVGDVPDARPGSRGGVDPAADRLMVLALRTLGFRWPGEARDGDGCEPVIPVRRLAARVEEGLAGDPEWSVDVDVARWLERELVPYHARRFRRRPVLAIQRGRVSLSWPGRAAGGSVADPAPDG